MLFYPGGRCLLCNKEWFEDAGQRTLSTWNWAQRCGQRLWLLLWSSESHTKEKPYSFLMQEKSKRQLFSKADVFKNWRHDLAAFLSNTRVHENLSDFLKNGSFMFSHETKEALWHYSFWPEISAPAATLPSETLFSHLLPSIRASDLLLLLSYWSKERGSGTGMQLSWGLFTKFHPLSFTQV